MAETPLLTDPAIPKSPLPPTPAPALLPALAEPPPTLTEVTSVPDDEAALLPIAREFEFEIEVESVGEVNVVDPVAPVVRPS